MPMAVALAMVSIVPYNGGSGEGGGGRTRPAALVQNGAPVDLDVLTDRQCLSLPTLLDSMDRIFLAPTKNSKFFPIFPGVSS